MRSKAMLGVAALVLASAVAAGIATAGSSVKQQRIAIAFDQKSGTFVLAPITLGPVSKDSGTYTSCCWTRRVLTRDGQSIEIDNPLVVMKGKRGTFTWREVITFAPSTNGYTVATAVWTIVRGSGVYAHLEGHGREAAVNKPESQEIAARAEGLVDLGR
jgi:hypothetical protein